MELEDNERVITSYREQLAITGGSSPAFATSKQRLTARERDVLRCAADGLSDDEIAARLFIQAFTVKTHLKHIYAKLGARNRAHAVALAYRHRMLEIAR